jgi:hypothetical protein
MFRQAGRVLAAVGIVLALLLAGAAPEDFPNGFAIWTVGGGK